jgi:[acyl-carrier-protein] S-malonyltransferase
VSSSRLRALVVCPGRGSYGKFQLGSLKNGSSIISKLDAFRASLNRPTITELDSAERYSGLKHVAGENASLLTFAATANDVSQLDPEKVDVIAVAGNSMGFYTALYASGALDLMEAARLVETMGDRQRKNVIGGQVLYPIVDEDWVESPSQKSTVQEVLTWENTFESISLGGTAVIGGDTEAVRKILRDMPKIIHGLREYPVQLPLHSAFHTPLMNETSDWAHSVLSDLAIRAPKIPLVAGDGRIFGRWASTDEILDYTLGSQVVDPYDFSKSIKSALYDYAPDTVVLPGPGDTMGNPVATIMIKIGWRGLRDKADFIEAQRSDSPVIISMTRENQRSLVVI